MSQRLAMIEKLLEGGSEDPFHWYARAMELRALGRLEEALGAYGEVRDRFPDYVPTYLMAGQMAEEMSRIDDARAWLTQGMEAARRAGDAHAVSELEAALDGLEI